MKLFKPGKAFAFGEYAVVKGFSSIILKTHRGLYFDIEASDHFKVLSSHVNYTYKENEALKTKVEKAVHQALIYLDNLKVSYQPCKITITSNLEQNSKSYGLGSSGAFVVGLIEAILKWHQVSYTKDLIFKLAVLSHQDEFHQTSYGDYAVSAYDSDIYYTKMKDIPKGTLIDCLNQEWPGLNIVKITMPISWTLINVHQKTSSENLVNQVFTYEKEIMPIIKSIDETSSQAYHSLKTLDLNLLNNLIQQSQALFESLAQKTKAPIIIPVYKPLIERARILDVYCKISGAGGGDNLICFGKKENLIKLKDIIDSKYFVFEGVNHES